MAYDQALAERLRDLLSGEEGLSEQKMFGGLAFLIHGNMSVAASSQGGLLLRVDPADPRDLQNQPGAEPFVMRGRAMEGWLRVAPGVVTTEADLEHWAAIGLAYARSLVPKR